MDNGSACIRVRNARHHNLKGIDVSIPFGKITTITGPSGSGKSTLVIDCLFAEGKNRYLDALGMDGLSLEFLDKPDVESIEFIPPPIAVEQKSVRRNPNSTVATVSGILEPLKLLFSCLGKPYCPECALEVKAYTVDQILDFVLAFPLGTKFLIMAPLLHQISERSLDEVLRDLRRKGFLRIKVNDEILFLDEAFDFSDNVHSIDLIIDRIIMKNDILARITDSVKLGLKMGGGKVTFCIDQPGACQSKFFSFNERSVCPGCGKEYPRLSPRLFSRRNADAMCQNCQGYADGCAYCDGTGLGPLTQNILIENTNFPSLLRMSIKRVWRWLITVEKELNNPDQIETSEIKAGKRLIGYLKNKMVPLMDMGLEYLELNRPVTRISGGEAQRLRIASQLIRNLTGTLYILDEPTADLHPKELELLWNNISMLKDQGNTVVIVEHNLDFIKRSDWVIELGPGAGESGGNVMFQGRPDDLKRNNNSLTSDYLSGARRLFRRNFSRGSVSGQMILKKANRFNLKNLTITFPLGKLVCITGVSGAGKSALFKEIRSALANSSKNIQGLNNSVSVPAVEFKGLLHTPRVINIDQISLSPSRVSTPATYMGIFDKIRQLFSRLPESRARGLTAGYFSLNRKGGRCERCKGLGVIVTNVGYLNGVECVCDICGGQRYNKETLSIKYKRLNIADVLDLTASQATRFFSRIPNIRRPLEVMERIGLGYLKLGQPASTLSRGESQRLKLARELAKGSKSPCLFLIDEPTRGMHLADIQKFIFVLDELLGQGHSLFVIENKPEFLSLSDWIIEMGPKGGPEGGRVIYEGPPPSKNCTSPQFNASGTFASREISCA